MIPKITVYVVSHNYGKYLSEAIESVCKCLEVFDNAKFSCGAQDHRECSKGLGSARRNGSRVFNKCLKALESVGKC